MINHYCSKCIAIIMIPIEVTLVGISTDVNDVQDSNALLLMTLMLVGMTIDVSPVWAKERKSNRIIEGES